MGDGEVSGEEDDDVERGLRCSVWPFCFFVCGTKRLREGRTSWTSVNNQ